MEKIPVSIITGYLGSGKTTLLKKILSEAKKKTAVIMNEFGEIGIDMKIVKGENVNVIELLNGCVCCSLTGDLGAAISEVKKKFKPEMIVIETTGVAEPGNLITNVQGIRGVKLDSVITIVDSDALLKFPNLGQTGREQIENADVILLNKMDLVPTDKIDDIERFVRDLNPRALIIKTTYSKIDTGILFGLEIERETKEHSRHNLMNFDTFFYESDRVHSKSEITKILTNLPKEVYRAKGYVRFSDGSHLFNWVNGRYEFEKSGNEPTQIVFIGEDIKKFQNGIIEDLENCQM